jgi:hypothetical protein
MVVMFHLPPPTSKILCHVTMWFTLSLMSNKWDRVCNHTSLQGTEFCIKVFETKNYLWYVLRGNVPHFVTSQVLSKRPNFTIQCHRKKEKVFSKVAKGIWDSKHYVPCRTHFKGMCTFLDILHACTCIHTFDLHLSVEILCFWWVKIQVHRTIVLQQLSEEGEWGASPMDQTDPVFTHAHIPGRWYSSIF